MCSRAVRIENTCYLDLNIVLSIVVKKQGFRATLTLIIAGTEANRVYIAPVFLVLWVYAWITINFTRRGLENFRFQAFSQAEHINCTEHTRFSSLDRISLVMDGRCRTS